jgi:diguanylate cyclase (GGDEF)-like protein
MDEWEESTGETPVPIVGARVTRAFLVAIQGSSVGSVYPLTGEPVELGRASRSDVVLFDDGISRKQACIVFENGRFHLHDLDSRNGTFRGGERIAKCALRHGDKISFGQRTVLRFTIGDDLDEAFQRKMYESAVFDGLTGVFNRRRFEEQVRAEIARATRHRIPLALLLLDLDYFKEVNDQYGHAAGDHALVEFAKCVQRLIRADETFARVGGEEFAILAVRSDTDAAMLAAERIRRAVESLEMSFEGHRFGITVSIGLASYPEVDAKDLATLSAAADSALYEAKRCGRNSVEIFQVSEFDAVTKA